MSSANVELHRAWGAAINARDIEAMIGYADPSIEMHTAVMAEAGGMPIYRGHDGVRAWLRDVDEVWEELHFEPEAYFDLGARTLAFCVQRGRGRHSGVQVEMPLTVVAGWRDDRCDYSKAYVRREDALSDLGVSENELERIDP